MSDPMRIDLIAVPYDSGHLRRRMGQGPEHLIEHGLPDRFAAAGHEVTVSIVDDGQGFPTETKTSFAVYRDVASKVAESRRAGALPVVLGGNCGNATAAAAGCGSERLAMLWLDAHGDYMTPETTRSGFLDGMAISVAAGRAWQTLAASIPQFRPVDPSRIVHVGARDWDPGERERFLADGGSVIAPSHLHGSDLQESLAGLAVRNAVELLVHVDFDVLDPEIAVVNPYPAPGGLSVEEIIEVVTLAARALPVAAIVFASYDPRAGGGQRATNAALQILDGIVGAVAANRDASS